MDLLTLILLYSIFLSNKNLNTVDIASNTSITCTTTGTTYSTRTEYMTIDDENKLYPNNKRSTPAMNAFKQKRKFY